MLTPQVFLVIAAYAVVLGCALTLCTRPVAGILQQEGYSEKGLLKWYFRVASPFLVRYALLACSLLCLVTLASVCFSFLGVDYANAAGGLVYVGACGVFVYAFRKGLKVPFAVTRRAVRLVVCEYILLTLFLFGCGVGLFCAAEAIGDDLARVFRLVPLVFMPFLLPLFLSLASLVMRIYETPRTKSLIRRAAKTLAASPCVKVGITGSFGKTSVKRIAADILSAKFRVIATPASYNTPVGIAKCVNEGGTDCDVFLAEMGARRTGEIAELCDLVLPSVGVVTGVCSQHLQTFGSLDAIRAEKGTLALRAERTVLGQTAAEMKRENSLAEGEDFAAEDVVLSADGVRFTLRLGEERYPVESSLLGRHAAEDIALAAALARTLGMTGEEIAAAIPSVKPIEHRLQKIAANGVTILDDSYNSNVVGARNAVEALRLFGGKKFVVTPGIVELGDIERTENEALGASFVGLDRVILVGETLVLPVRNGYLGAGGEEERLTVVPTLGKAQALLGEELREGDAVLFLNDLPDKYL